MKTNASSYRGHRFPREIISHGVWLYHRFSLSFRDVEELLAKRGIVVTTADPLYDYPAAQGWKWEGGIINLVGKFIESLPKE